MNRVSVSITYFGIKWDDRFIARVASAKLRGVLVKAVVVGGA